MTATVNQWLGALHNPIFADVSKTVLQWISLHKAQGLVYALGALAALSAILHKFYHFVLDQSGCEIQIRGEDQNAEYLTAWLKQRFNNRLGTNQTADTCISRPSESQRKYYQDGNTGYWRYDRAYRDLYTSYNVGYGHHFFLYHKRIWMFQRIKGQSETNQSETLSIRCIGSWSPIQAQNLIEEAKRNFLKCESSVTQIFIPAAKTQRQKGLGEPWTCIQEAKLSRDITTVDLADGVKEDIIADLELFLSPKQYQNYIRKGIRYGRNILLHGPPGTGKTALIESLSGLFGLDIYRVSLSSPELTDDDFTILLSRVRPKSFVLFEDIDQAGLPTRRTTSHAGRMTGPPSEGCPQSVQSLTLSGFLNAIDGVATPEGPIAVFTTNCLEDLDPAIIRPGRVDRIVRLGLANRGQIQAIFCRMYSSKSTTQSILKKEAEIFANKVRDRRFSPASIQGFLLQHQQAPDSAIAVVEEWQDEQLTPTRSDEHRAVMSIREIQDEQVKQRFEVTEEYVSSTGKV